MAGKLTKEQLKEVKKGSVVAGAALIKDYRILDTKSGGKYIMGNITAGIDMTFKVWSNAPAYNYFTENECRGEVCYLDAKGDEYGGTTSLVVNNAQAISDYKPDEFMERKYDEDSIYEKLRKVVYERLSEQGKSIANKVLFENPEVESRFRVEYAAKSHHDNCINGLLMHTYMVVIHVARICTDYKGIIKSRADLDLLMLGSLFHDIGKIREMNMGVYQDISVTTHRHLGLEMLAEHKAEMVNTYGEMWYYHLSSILLQHHGEYGDPCKTVYAQIVHMADNYEAQMRTMSDLLADKTDAFSNVSFNGARLACGITLK